MNHIYKSSFYYLRLIHTHFFVPSFILLAFLIKHYDSTYSQVIIPTLIITIIGLKKNYLIDTSLKKSITTISFYGIILFENKQNIDRIKSIKIKPPLSPGVLSYTSYERNLLELSFTSDTSPRVYSLMICKKNRLHDLKRIKNELQQDA